MNYNTSKRTGALLWLLVIWLSSCTGASSPLVAHYIYNDTQLPEIVSVREDEWWWIDGPGVAEPIRDELAQIPGYESVHNITWTGTSSDQFALTQVPGQPTSAWIRSPVIWFERLGRYNGEKQFPGVVSEEPQLVGEGDWSQATVVYWARWGRTAEEAQEARWYRVCWEQSKAYSGQVRSTKVVGNDDCSDVWDEQEWLEHDMEYVQLRVTIDVPADLVLPDGYAGFLTVVGGVPAKDG